MDLSKYPLERVFYLVAGVIPGFIALLIFYLSSPGSFAWFFSSLFLGYRTKIAIVVLAAFVIGNSLTTFLSGIMGACGGVVGTIQARKPYKSSYTYDFAPWRDPRWRLLMRQRLGDQAPNDTRLITDHILDQHKQVIELLPENQRAEPLANLILAKSNAELDDMRWEQWYAQYHQQVTLQSGYQDFAWHVRSGLNYNLQAASVYVLVAAVFVPSLRHWWWILPACFWVVLMVAEALSGVRNLMDKWSSLSVQIQYLREGRL